MVVDSSGAGVGGPTPGVDEQTLFVSLGAVQGHAAIGWPCRMCIARSQVWFAIDTSAGPGDVRWMSVCELAGWHAYDSEWSSPLFQQLYAKSDARFITIRKKTECLPILSVAARNAFWRLPVHTMKRLTIYLGIGTVSGEGLYVYLNALVRHALAGHDEESFEEILSPRLAAQHKQKSDLLQDECVAQIFETDKETNILEDHLAASKIAKQTFGDYREAFFRERTSRQPKGNSKEKARTLRPKAVAWPTLLSQEFANSLVPPEARISKDPSNQRWLGVVRPHGTISRSWPLYGEVGSLRIGLRALWGCHGDLSRTRLSHK